jgi:hypothetical protein
VKDNLVESAKIGLTAAAVAVVLCLAFVTFLREDIVDWVLTTHLSLFGVTVSVLAIAVAVGLRAIDRVDLEGEQ